VTRLRSAPWLAPYARAGATWWLTEFELEVPPDQVHGVLRDGPAEGRAEAA
jgi:hypothetical protein